MEGIEGKLKVWIRRVWTLEMVRLSFSSSSSSSSSSPPSPSSSSDTALSGTLSKAFY